jgi:hypothetical protein
MAEGQITAKSSAKAIIQTAVNLKRKVRCDGNAGVGKSSQMSEKMRQKRNGDKTEPSSRPKRDNLNFSKLARQLSNII